MYTRALSSIALVMDRFKSSPLYPIEEVTPVDHQILHVGGSTSTLDRLPSRLQQSKSQRSLSLRDELEELAYENSYLKAELAWNKETRQVLMHLHGRTLEAVSILSEALTETTSQLRRSSPARSPAPSRRPLKLFQYVGQVVHDFDIQTTSSGAHPRLNSVLWVTSAVAGFISLALAVSVLLDPEFAESGVSIFRFNFTSLLSTQFLSERQLELLSIPEASSEDVPPIVATAVEGAASDIQAAQTVVSSALQAAATDAATAVQSDLSTVVPENMSIGLGKVCFGWENNSTQDCRGLPFNISSVVPSTLSGILSAPLQQLQEVENKVVSAILETVRRSLIVGIVLLLMFFLLLLFWEFPNDLWRRAVMTPLGFTCLVVPFLISTAVMFVVQSDIRKKIDDSSLISVQDGGASNLILVGLIFSILMFGATVSITLI
ncbi:conserved hypothetical protein [Talaromyces stipitatus ATCC 10500]|uniref:Uncharacterized protein n=1 Tax=Talaromyces stipitatus (strain ATCC 10500 / CBS 375.48 / QM 6759 / NRRL 1006) TaxID=441959 RepID=B8LU43_TALSN|nr:uncharacterized protein TSTA_060130 [Talaromyces stipitatus ATCC 10500]EED22515.1 conserved hypothetical protein [Talaromyces stipitatus ATCC 10500]